MRPLAARALTSSRGLIERSARNIDRLRNDLAPYFMADDLVQPWTWFNEETGQQHHGYQVVRSAPFDAFQEISSIINDQRHALDQACFAAAAAAFERPGRRTDFPWSNSRSEFESALKRSKHLPPALHNTLWSLEPWLPTQDEPGGNTPLAVLCRVTGPNKHRFTVEAEAAGDAYELGKIRVRSPDDDVIGGGMLHIGPEWDSDARTLTLVRVVPRAIVTLDGSVLMRLRWVDRETPAVHGLNVFMVLANFDLKVRAAVDLIEPYTR